MAFSFSFGGLPIPIPPLTAKTTSACLSNNSSHSFDAAFIKRAAELADKSAGFTAPHPNFGCVIATTANGDRKGDGGAGVVVGEGYLYAEGTSPAELQAVESAGEFARGATAYLNMEPGDCYSDRTAVSALINVCTLLVFFFSIYIFFTSWKYMMLF